MIVKKFGGTSVGTPERIRNVAALVCNDPHEQKVVVLSAMSGTTNSLVEICSYLYNNNIEGAIDVISKLEKKYEKVVEELFTDALVKGLAYGFITDKFTEIRTFTKGIFTAAEEKAILAQGEIISTFLMSSLLKEMGVEAVLLNSLDFMRLNEKREPDTEYIKAAFTKALEKEPCSLYIVQGFICRNAFGQVDNLERGGSDYTASILGAAAGAEVIEIWTDIDGMHNNDPRVVEGTKAVRHLHFDEAAELAYFGAKILHPTCIQPAKFANIPVRLLNTMDPSAEGTLIDNAADTSSRIKAIAAKDKITAIRIKSSRMLLAHGFLRKVFEIFESYRTSIDMICTSEVGVSLSIDNTTHLSEIVHDLKQYGTVTVDHDMTIICVVGDMEWENVGLEAKALDAMKEIPVRMVSFGGSDYNISFLVRNEDKTKALKALNKIFD